MSGKHSDKLVKESRAREVMYYLTKLSALQAPQPGLMDNALTAADRATTASQIYDTGRGTYGAANALKAGQGVRQAGSAFAAPFGGGATAATWATRAPGAWGATKFIGGRALPWFGAAMSGVGTAASISNQVDASKEFKGTGRSYLGSEGGMWDTLDTLGQAAPMAGAVAGTFAGGPVGTAVGAGIGYAAQLGASGVKYVGQGLTGYDSNKDRMARAQVKGQGYNNSMDFLQDGIAAANNNNSDYESTSWLGRKRNFQQENLGGYLQQERTNRARSLTNKSQVA